ncbi:MAG: dTDP-4-dehydrorhamnose 3,5-epimerase [Candidatus Omnitrophota bacterium]|nr:MAG: dTDP-4-dehydrorhamnose 3,5-epimerase [Candidatus Omnitrophota bacterium]
MAFRFSRLAIPEVILIEPQVFEDERGFFMEVYVQEEFRKFGIKENFIQDNHSYSRRGVIRGLHFQSGNRAQSKLVRCIKGEIFDVVVDVRKGSPSYGRYLSVILSEENRRMLYVPKGFAHGFCALKEGTEVVYKCDEIYSPAEEKGIIWNDKEINISWPITTPLLSLKDRSWPPLREVDSGFVYSQQNRARE